MFAVDGLILISAILLLLGIVSSKFSARVGLPVLVLFLVVGILAGSEGIGGIAFEDYTLAHGIGTTALAVILFDGGLRTPLSSIKLTWKPSLVLATFGVLITSVVTGLAAMYILGLSLYEGILLGGIVGSTDAAAVFATMRTSGVNLREHIAATLEVESGSNDPMAIFLTVGMLQVLAGEAEFGLDLVWLFIEQMAIGAVIGIGFGFAAVWVTNKINLGAAGMYPVLVGALGLLTFGVAAALGGSGFLAIFLAGIVIGNRNVVFKRGIFLFHDAGAWLSQIVMFIMLGLLTFPSRLIEVAPQGLAITVVLIFIARPLAVMTNLIPFRFEFKEMVFLSWVGLKGAVPITLATFPLLAGLPVGPLIFDAVFFVVLISAITQGITLPYFARKLGLEVPAEPDVPLTLEITSLRHVDGDIIQYTVGEESRAAGHLIRELALPEGVVVAIIARGHEMIPPHGNTPVYPGDHVYVVLNPQTRDVVDQIFSREPRGNDPDTTVEFTLRGTTTVGEVEEFYSVSVDAPNEQTLSDALRDRLPKERLRPGTRVIYGDIALCVKRMGANGAVEQVALTILPQNESPPDA